MVVLSLWFIPLFPVGLLQYAYWYQRKGAIEKVRLRTPSANSYQLQSRTVLPGTSTPGSRNMRIRRCSNSPLKYGL